MFGGGGIGVRPAENALAVRHGVNAEGAERGVLKFPIGRMVFDVLDVAAEFVAMHQHRGMAVADAGAFIQPAAGQLAEPVQMRVQMRYQIGWQVEPEQVAQRAVVAVEILAGGVRGNRGHCGRFLMR